MRRMIVVALMAAPLVVGAPGVVGAATGSDAATTTVAGRDRSVCDRLATRVAEVPEIRDRISRRLEKLERRLTAVRDPQRRARLQARVENLRALDERLLDLVARAEARCPELA